MKATSIGSGFQRLGLDAPYRR